MNDLQLIGYKAASGTLESSEFSAWILEKLGDTIPRFEWWTVTHDDLVYYYSQEEEANISDIAGVIKNLLGIFENDEKLEVIHGYVEYIRMCIVLEEKHEQET